jgi:hypothetical protein
MRAKRIGAYLLAIVLSVVAFYVVLRKHSTIARPHYPPESILINPGGTCALVEYKFRGGERWSWPDPYALFTLSGGNAFYTIVDLRSGRIVRDSTTSIIAIPAQSQDSIGMGSAVHHWSKDGSVAAFPGGDGPFYEWTDIKECAGTTRQSEYANASCNLDSASAKCEKLRAKLSPRSEGATG